MRFKIADSPTCAVPDINLRGGRSISLVPMPATLYDSERT